MYKIITALLFALNVAPSNAAGADCDPQKILTQDVVSAQSNIFVQLAILQQMASSSASSKDFSLGVKIDGVPLDASTAESLQQKISSSYSYQLRQSESLSIFKSTLSPASVQAYTECLKKSHRNVVVKFVDGAGGGAIGSSPLDALEDLDFQIAVTFDPETAPASKRLSLSVSNAKVSGPTERDLNYPSTTIFKIKRGSLDERVTISATVNGMTDSVVLPARPKFRFATRVVQSPRWSISRGGKGADSSIASNQLCAHPDEDQAVLVPSTARLQGVVRGDSVNRQLDGGNNSRTVCANISVGARCDEDKCSSSIDNGGVDVEEIRIVERPK